MKIVIDLELSPRQKKIIRAAVVTGAVIGAMGIGLAVAAPHQWKASDPLAAADLNSLDVVSKNGKQISLGGTYCGKTGSTKGQISGAYSGAKSQCEGVLACGSSTTAHTCDAGELVRTAQLGIAIDQGWFSTGTGASTAPPLNDCNGWTDMTGSYDGLQWASGPGVYGCSLSAPILCCD